MQPAPSVPGFVSALPAWGAFAADSVHADIALYSNALKATDHAFNKAFETGRGAAELVTARAAVVDEVVVAAARSFGFEDDGGIALIAIGGYGRGELHPQSDVDLLLLLKKRADKATAEKLSTLITFLWDIGLKVGHSTRTVKECVSEGRDDVTVATSLMESRVLLGDRQLHETMLAKTGPDKIWPSRKFFTAKLEEQQSRHQKFGDTAYRLEPNLKEGPGGLRDIQIIGWVAKRHFGAISLHELVERDFLTEYEYQALVEGQTYLWRVRFALHMLAGRSEDRLLFDHQRALAELFGYTDQDHNLAVEQFMQRYYRWVTELERLNEMLLQHYQEAILYDTESASAKPINRRFQTRKGFLEVVDDEVFERYPTALLELFLLLEQDRELKGVRASTIRLVRQYRNLIDASFRANIASRSLFMEILRQPHGVSHELRRMNRYGVLAAYWPAFANIVGRMQYDLFHVYTVDEHTMFVLRNVRRFSVDEWAHDLPFCNALFPQLPKPEILYLAVLFHDIAKGRGGDHSELGATESETFCLEHGLGSYDAQLVAWLVRNHLLMSVTAQRQDISDPAVVNRFAGQVGNTIRLNYLYLLTVADIRGTNPELWNDWKKALLTELYHSTKNVLRRGLDQPLQRAEIIDDAKRSAQLELTGRGISEAQCQALWQRFDDDYFMRHSGDEIAWHAQAILGADTEDEFQVLVRDVPARGCTEIFIHSPDRAHLFAHVASCLSQLGLDILDARIITTSTGETLDTFLVLEENGKSVAPGRDTDEIIHTLTRLLNDVDAHSMRVTRRLPYRLRSFNVPVQINFSNEPGARFTILELIMADYPGLLARAGIAFIESGVLVHNARISTLGASVEDLFYITDINNQPITNEDTQAKVRRCLLRHLDTLRDAASNVV